MGEPPGIDPALAPRPGAVHGRRRAAGRLLRRRARSRSTWSSAPTGTPFQLAVWEALRDDPLRRDAQLRRAGRRDRPAGRVAGRGAANGNNPLSIVVPCHRVIGADGSLTGFGGGLPRKQWLLAMERGQAQMPLYADGPTVSA